MKPTNTQLGYESPPGFGLRQSSAALEARAHPVLKTSIESEDVRLVGKRQRTAAVQNAIARLKPPSRMGPFVGRLSNLGKHLTGTSLDSRSRGVRRRGWPTLEKLSAPSQFAGGAHGQLVTQGLASAENVAFDLGERRAQFAGNGRITQIVVVE